MFLTYRRLPLIVAVVFAVSGCASTAADHHGAMIAVAHPLAAEAGLEILKAGGSAVDAAIAAEMVLTLVEPQSSGIGGGAFLVHHAAAGGAIDSYDGRETAPKSAVPEMFLSSSGSPKSFSAAALGGRAVGIPGLIRMLALAHAEHGRLPWALLFEPAIKLARDGFRVSPRLASAAGGDRDFERIAQTREYFRPGGKRIRAGDILKNPALASTLDAVAQKGPAGFYEGPVALAIADAVSHAPANPAPLSAIEIAGYEAKKRPPACAPYRAWRVCSMGPPSSGGIALLQSLGMLENFDLARMAPFSIEAIHLILEASRLAFADRDLYVADPDHVPVPTEGLLSRPYLQARAQLIDPTRSMGQALPGRPTGAPGDLAAESGPERGQSTTHLAVRDSDGNTVSMTATVERGFGSKLMAAGFILNNELTDFSFLPTEFGKPIANRALAGKRPRSTMTPTLVFDADGKMILAIGSPGGARIAGYVLKTVIAVLDWKMDIQAAIAAPNFVNRNGPTEIEAATPLAAIAPALASLGHDIRFRSLESGLHGIEVTAKGLRGGADPRREGVALGLP